MEIGIQRPRRDGVLATVAKDNAAKGDVEFDPLIDKPPGRYVVGIDLGTTNSAVTYVDTDEQPWQVRVLPLPQLVGPGEVESRESLPSFHFQPTPSQYTPDARACLGRRRRQHSPLVSLHATKVRKIRAVKLCRPSRGFVTRESTGLRICCPGMERKMSIASRLSKPVHGI